MSSTALKEMIDRMVAESIRRILPGVMNEVLLTTIARSGVVQEAVEEEDERPRRRKAKRRKPIVERDLRVAKRTAKAPAPKRPKKLDLSELLDESAGAEFYAGATTRHEPVDEGYDIDFGDDEDEAPGRPHVAGAVANLPPELRELAEGMVLDEDDGEMWGAGEHDSGAPTMEGVADPTPIRDIGQAAKAVGIDFSRMKSAIGKIEPKVDRRELAEAARAKAQFEQNRIKMLQERLNKKA